MASTAVRRGFTFAIAEPIATAYELLPQFLITTASVYMVAQFGTAHHILPAEVAYPMAVGFEWTWLRGVATAAKVKRGAAGEFWIRLLTVTALVTVLAYGILYILGLPSIGVIPDRPGPGWGALLAVAKVVPIALMGFAAANLHRVHKQEVHAEQDRAAERDRERQAAQQRAIDAIEAERQRRLMELDVWRQGQEVKQQLRQRAASAAAPSRRKPVTIDGVTYASRAAAAKALGISPQAVSKRAQKA